MMEFKIARLKCLQLKTALAVAIIRSRPSDMSLEEYILAMRTKFHVVYQSHHDEIDSLKRKLLEAKKEIFNLRVVAQTQQAQAAASTDNNANPLTPPHALPPPERNTRLARLLHSLDSNVAFVSNLVKLKSVETMLREGLASEDEIGEWLRTFLAQIERFFFRVPMTTNEEDLSFPYDSLLHAAQMFVNAYQLEWLYHLRSQLVDRICKFVDSLVQFCLKQPQNGLRKNLEQLACAHHMLVAFSTSNHLVNPVVYSIVNGLIGSIDHLCEIHNANNYTKEKSNSTGEEEEEEEKETMMMSSSRAVVVESIALDCVRVCHTIQSMLQIRLLDNYVPLSEQLQQQLARLLNTVFVKLTDSYPLVAIELSKLIQLLTLTKTN